MSYLGKGNSIKTLGCHDASKGLRGEAVSTKKSLSNFLQHSQHLQPTTPTLAYEGLCCYI